MSTFPEPVADGFTVYTKEDCKFCSLVKELLADEEVVFIVADAYLDRKEEFFEALGCTQRTFPVVFFDGILVGGFTETLKMLRERDGLNLTPLS